MLCDMPSCASTGRVEDAHGIMDSQTKTVYVFSKAHTTSDGVLCGGYLQPNTESAVAGAGMVCTVKSERFRDIWARIKEADNLRQEQVVKEQENARKEQYKKTTKEKEKARKEQQKDTGNEKQEKARQGQRTDVMAHALAAFMAARSTNPNTPVPK